MQKTFVKYTAAIITSAILLILFINFLFMLQSLESQQFSTFLTKSGQVMHIMENNSDELAELNKSLDTDYLTRARAATYVMDHHKEISMDVQQMQYLAELLNVDELHVIDENGMIVSASVSQYIGIDMDDHEQTREFLSLLENKDEDAYLIQEPQPNAAEGKVMKYIGVARKGQKGFVQVGFEPVRQMEAQSRNTYEYIFSKFPTDVGEELFAVDCTTGKILGHSDGMDRQFSAEYYQLDELKECTGGAYKEGENGRVMYVAAQQYGNVMICGTVPRHQIFHKLWSNVLTTFICLLLIEVAVLLLLNYLVRQKVVGGIHRIIGKLEAITAGNLDTAVEESGNPEFKKLSNGINAMVKSIVSLSDRISSIIKISGIPLAAFEYETGAGYVFATPGLRQLLDIPEQTAEELYCDPDLFDEYIHNITKVPLKGEEDIYRVSDSQYVCIHMAESSRGNLGVITDVSDQVIQKIQMQYENTHDPLTGLYKFPYFKDLASEILQSLPEDEICAAVMMDLDSFKTINDTYGHDIGDKYLESFAKVMLSMPEEHYITARRSGDEFCMFIFHCHDVPEVRGYVNEFYKVLNECPVILSETNNIVISASAGFACADGTQQSITVLLNHADEALYEVKNETKGRYREYQQETVQNPLPCPHD